MTMTRHACFAAALLALLALPLSAGAISIYDEGADGDLSGNRLAPTSRALAAGVNSVSSSSVAGDLDYLHLTVPAGLAISSIVLAAYDSLNPQSFIGVQAGAVFSEDAAAPDVANLLGWNHFGTGPGQVGTDILDDIAVGPGAIGFTPPLTGSDYTFWLQETGPSPATYSLDFVVTPEPASALLVALGLVGLASARRSS